MFHPCAKCTNLVSSLSRTGVRICWLQALGRKYIKSGSYIQRASQAKRSKASRVYKFGSDNRMWKGTNLVEAPRAIISYIDHIVRLNEWMSADHKVYGFGGQYRMRKCTNLSRGFSHAAVPKRTRLATNPRGRVGRCTKLSKYDCDAINFVDQPVILACCGRVVGWLFSRCTNLVLG